MMVEAGHADAVREFEHMLDGEGKVPDSTVVKAQDFHTMLDHILDGYVKLQDSGFYFDLFYKGKLYENVEFKMFVPFLSSVIPRKPMPSVAHTPVQRWPKFAGIVNVPQTKPMIPCWPIILSKLWSKSRL